MAERTARLGSMFYLDADGRYRTAAAGDTIKVHPDYLERFDRLNHLMGEDDKTVEPAEEPATPVEEKPKRGRPRKVVDKP